jgi:hypothetical protein
MVDEWLVWGEITDPRVWRDTETSVRAYVVYGIKAVGPDVVRDTPLDQDCVERTIDILLAFEKIRKKRFLKHIDESTFFFADVNLTAIQDSTAGLSEVPSVWSYRSGIIERKLHYDRYRSRPTQASLMRDIKAFDPS